MSGNSMTQVTFEGVSWNCSSVMDDGLTEGQFISQGLHEGQYRGFTEADQRELLREAYRQIQLLWMGLKS